MLRELAKYNRDVLIAAFYRSYEVKSNLKNKITNNLSVFMKKSLK